MEKNENTGYGKERDEIFSKAVRAGKRTYFFDVKSTRKNDYYLTITESKKKFEDDGSHSYEKHKLFLYKEDFEKFTEGLEEVFGYIKENLDSQDSTTELTEINSEEKFTNVEFDDLDK
ncbi:MAG: DUF3276 family protein [Salinivirgaceae bacterium]|nr:DUF3276 family protein [Salinivirgaceae bacterium]MDD4746830.1 DUF3276 family protein [Salinivirgaceae bacterium]MDY0280685.1 DUF3276 family protein [Salinivirgaceae bacterium]